MNILEKKQKTVLYTAFFFALIFGSAFAVFIEYDFGSNPDIQSYLGISAMDFDQSPVRRYRIIVPLLASLVSMLFGPVLDLLQPWNFDGAPFSLAFSYLLVNSALMSLVFVFLFRAATYLGVSPLASILGSLCLISSRWTGYFSGLPWVDSLYLLAIAMMLYSFISKDKKALIAAIIIGPWAKEAFIFFIPLCLYYGCIDWKKQSTILFLTGISILAFRYAIDHYFALDPTESYSRDIEHFGQITMSLRRLCSFHGIYELFSITGFWILLLLLIGKRQLGIIIKKMPAFSWAFLAIVMIHALLSTELARMFYIGGLLYVLLMALVFEYLINNGAFKKFFSNIAISDKE